MNELAYLISRLLLNLMLIVGGLFLLFRLTKTWPLSRYFLLAILIKLISGIGLGLVYHHFYHGGDTLTLFEDGVVLAKLFRSTPITYFEFLIFNTPEQHEAIYIELFNSNSRAILMSKFISVFNLLTGDNYWVSCCYFSTLAFIGIWFCANQLAMLFPSFSKAIFFSFFIVPSFTFWTAGILKESLLWMAQGSIIAYFLFIIRVGLVKRKVGWAISKKAMVTIWILACLYLSWKIKYYYLAALLPALIPAFLVLKYFPKSLGMIPTLSAYLLCYLSIAVLASNLHVNLSLDFIAEVMVKNYYMMANDTKDISNLIYYRSLEPSWESIFKNSPKAIWEGFFRPYLWEAGHILKKVTAFEQTLLFALLVGWISKNCPTPSSHTSKVLLLSAFSFILVSVVLLAIAAPNLGNLIRYKCSFLPFLWFLLLAGNRLTDERINSLMPFNRQ